LGIPGGKERILLFRGKEAIRKESSQTPIPKTGDATLDSKRGRKKRGALQESDRKERGWKTKTSKTSQKEVLDREETFSIGKGKSLKRTLKRKETNGAEDCARRA